MPQAKILFHKENHVGNFFFIEQCAGSTSVSKNDVETHRIDAPVSRRIIETPSDFTSVTKFDRRANENTGRCFGLYKSR